MLVPSPLGVSVGSRVILSLWKKKFVMHLLQNRVESAYPRCKPNGHCNERAWKQNPQQHLSTYSFSTKARIVTEFDVDMGEGGT
jgi:hypothetical protein